MALVLEPPAFIMGPPGCINGVASYQGTPKESMRVIAIEPRSGSIVRETWSGPGGEYTIKGLRSYPHIVLVIDTASGEAASSGLVDPVNVTPALELSY